jgi:hypothetical protein
MAPTRILPRLASGFFDISRSRGIQRREAARAGASAALGHIQQEGWRFCRIEDQDGSAVPHSDAIDPGIIDALTSGLSVAFPEPRLKARF